MTLRSVVFLFAMAIVTTITLRAQAQTEGQIRAARETFAAALKDEQAHHFEEALAKYSQVEQVKDTPQVRYRIGTCLVALGKLREARKTFASIHARPGNRDDQETEQGSAEILKSLATRVPDLTVRMSGRAAGQSALTIDQIAASADAPTELDPGEHVIVVAGTGVKRSETRVTITEGTHQVLTLVAESDAPPPPPERVEPAATPSPRAPDPISPAPVSSDSAQPGPPPATPSQRRTYGFVALGVGGALLVGSVLAIIVQHGQVSTISNDCPAPSLVCPAAKGSDVLSAQSSANTDSVLAATFGVGAAVAAGVGAYLVLTSHAQVTVAPSTTGAVVRLGGVF